jgi:hypothetical protein
MIAIQSITRTPRLFRYTAFGLGIQSFLPLPELISEEREPDVEVRLGCVDAFDLHTIDEERSFKATAEEAYYFFAGVGKFLVRRGREVIVEPSPDADLQAIRLCLLGPIIALILHQQGKLILHASAVAVNGKGIAFLGGQGWGKSTLAAALDLRGHGMLADDVTAIHMASPTPMVLPAFPQFKLWPNSIVALGNTPEKLPLLHPRLSKRSLRTNLGFSLAPLPLKRIYVLAPGQRVEIEPLSLQESLKEMIRHSYAARFGTHLLQGIGGATHFKQCARIVQDARLYRFRRPSSLSLLDEHVSLLINDVSRDEQ